MAMAAHAGAGAGARVRSLRGARVRSSRPRAARTRRAAAAEDVATATEASPCSSSSSASRYVASNRFSINPGAAAKFEARWATRKSRLAVLDGFRFFSLLRLTGDVDGAGAAADELGLYNYVSFTIWSEKKDFNAWRTGEAFKEAHGGGTIFGFVDMLVNSIGVLRGPPKPVFYDGLLPRARAPAPPAADRVVEGGWRVVDANGRDRIDAEVFAACVAFTVQPGGGDGLLAHWGAAAPEGEADADGFVCSLLMRRDASVKMHGSEDPSSLPAGEAFSAFAFFEDGAARDAWAESAARRARAYGGGFTQEPACATYEGVLVLEDPALGA